MKFPVRGKNQRSKFCRNFDIIAFFINVKKFGIVLEAGIGRFYFQEFWNKKKVSKTQIITLNELNALKKRLHLVGNTLEVNTMCTINARDVSQFAIHQIKMSNTSTFVHNYIEPECTVNHYL